MRSVGTSARYGGRRTRPTQSHQGAVEQFLTPCAVRSAQVSRRRRVANFEARHDHLPQRRVLEGECRKRAQALPCRTSGQTADRRSTRCNTTSAARGLLCAANASGRTARLDAAADGASWVGASAAGSAGRAATTASSSCCSCATAATCSASSRAAADDLLLSVRRAAQELTCSLASLAVPPGFGRIRGSLLLQSLALCVFSVDRGVLVVYCLRAFALFCTICALRHCHLVVRSATATSPKT